MTEPSRPLFFCHLPKTGGTSLRMGLESAFLPHEIIPDRYMMARFGGHYPDISLVVQNVIRQRDAIKLVRGHYHLSLRMILSNPICITVLREPVSRVVSNLKHIIQHGGATAAEILSDLDRGVIKGVPANAMTRYLGGQIDDLSSIDVVNRHNILLYGPIRDGAERLSSAIRSLETIDILGISENMCSVATDLFGLGISLPIKPVNVSKAGLLELSDAQKDRIRELNSLDVALYDAAKSQVDERNRI